MRRHTNKNNRRFHFAAAVIAIIIVVQSILTLSLFDLIYAVLIYFGLVYAGHHFCQEDKPSFANPMGSLKCQIRMYKEMVTRKIDF